jgi:Domain of unknown function (DUF4340)
MRTKITLVLLFLNAALFLYIFRFESGLRTERVAQEVRRRVLGGEAADIRSLRVVSTAAGGSYSLEKRGDSWLMTQPFEWRANPHAVARIISDLQLLDHEASFRVADVEKSGQSLADYGLDHPRLEVTFTSGGPDTTGSAPVTTTLRIGSATKAGQRLYLLAAGGERIHVVGRAIADSLSLSVGQLRDETVLTIPVFEARSVNLQTAAPAELHIRLRRDGGRWSFETPIVARGGKTAIELAINRLDALKVGSFIAAGAAAAEPSAAPALSVTIEGYNRHETLFVGQPVAGAAPAAGEDPATLYYAQLEGRPTLFTVAIPASLMETLRNAQDELRDRHVLDFDPGAVTGISIAAPNRPEIALQSDAAGGAEPRWQIVLRGDGAQGPRTLPADPAAVQRLLGELSTLSAQRFQSDAPQASDLENWGFNRPEREVTLSVAARRDGDGAQAIAIVPQVVLQVGLPTRRDGTAYARVANTPYIYMVSQDILRETAADVGAWRDRQIRVLPAGAAIVALRIADVAGGVLLDWRQGTSLDPARERAVRALVEGLRVLRARRFAAGGFAEKPEEGAHPWKYRVDAGISLPGGAAAGRTGTSTLWVAERSGAGEQWAGSREFDTVFELEQGMLDALWTLTYRARDPGPPLGAP